MDDEEVLAPSRITAMELARYAMEAFAARSLRFLTMALAFVLCGACVIRPHWIALTAASVFVALVSPLWWRREKRDA